MNKNTQNIKPNPDVASKQQLVLGLSLSLLILLSRLI